MADDLPNPGGTLQPPGGGQRRGRWGRGGKKWASGSLEFDTAGVEKFTTAIKGAETAVGGFVAKVSALKTLLDKMPQEKIDALTKIGGGGGAGGGTGYRNGGDGVRFPELPAGGDPEGDQTTFRGERARRGTTGRNGGDSKFMGEEESGIARAYFATQIAQQVGGTVGQFYEQSKNKMALIDYANQIGRIRAPGMASTFARQDNWRGMAGVTGTEDAAALQNQMRSMLGQQLFSPRQDNLTRQLAALNLINPEFGSASAAGQHYAQSFLSPQAAWSGRSFGLQGGVVGGNMQDPNKFMESVILKATGKQSWSQLRPEDTADLFSMWGKGRSNVQAMFPGVTPEMLDTLSLAASHGAKHGGLEEGWQRKAMNKTLQAEIMKGPEQQLEHDAQRTRENRASMRAMIAGENAAAEAANDVASALGDLLPWVEKLGEVLAGVAGAAGIAAAATGGVAGRVWGRVRNGKAYQGKHVRGSAPKGSAPRNGPRVRGRVVGGVASAAAVQGAWHAAGKDDTFFGIEGTRGDDWSNLVDPDVLAQVPGRIAGGVVDSVKESWKSGGPSLKKKGPAIWEDPIAWAFGDPVEIGDPGDASKVPSDLDPSFASRLRKLFNDAPFDLGISSGRRSRKKQEELYAAYKAGRGNLAAKPGTSKHEKGHAVDITVNGGKANNNPAWRAWISANAGKYGLRHGGNFSQAEWWHLETPGKVSEAAVSSDESTPVPGLGGGAGGGIGGGGGFSAKKRFLSGFNTNLTSLLEGITGVEKFTLSGGGGGGGTLASGAAAGGGGGGTVQTSGPVSQQQAYKLALGAGFSPDQARVMAAIAMGESTGSPTAHNTKGKDNSYGLWQINMLGAMGPARRSAFGISSNDALFDPATNARAAKSIFDSQGFKAWSVYTSDKYRDYMGNEVGDPVASGGGMALASSGGGGGGGRVVLGGRSIHIDKVSLTVKTETVSDTEAERLGRMVIAKIREQAEMAELGAS